MYSIKILQNLTIASNSAENFNFQKIYKTKEIPKNVLSCRCISVCKRKTAPTERHFYSLENDFSNETILLQIKLMTQSLNMHSLSFIS